MRKYSGEQELIWGEDKKCEHEWGELLLEHHPGQVEQTKWKNADAAGHGQTAKSGQFCSLCGAWRGGFGLEPIPELYIQHTIEILREIRRVLRKDGTVWWNIGDSMWGSWGSMSHDMKGKAKRAGTNERPPASYSHNVLKPLDCCLIPFRVAIAVQEDGWYVRQVIVWQKNNPMPESVNGWRWEKHRVKIKSIRIVRPNSHEAGVGDGRRGTDRGYTRPDGGGGASLSTTPSTIWQDCPGCPKCSPNGGYVLRKGAWRPTEAHEYILQLTKTDTYYGDGEEVREPQTKGSIARWDNGANGRKRYDSSQYEQDRGSYIEFGKYAPTGITPDRKRNLRSVWSFPTAQSKVKHFAVYPEKLPSICIKASTPEVGVCPKCGAPWVRVVERKSTGQGITTDNGLANLNRGNDRVALRLISRAGEVETTTLSWRPSCRCGVEDKVPATVLDPFVGSGTTCAMAKSFGRRSIGIDISEAYMKLAIKRIKRIEGVKMPLAPITEKV